MSRLTGDFLRLLSILAVLTIHATGGAEWRFAAHATPGDFVAALLNQMGRFCVPVFVILSGYGLAAKYHSYLASRFPYRDFFAGRLLKIGAPFLAVTLVLLTTQHQWQWNPALSAGANLIFNAGVLGRALFIQGAYYHLYFFTIILECYAVFPLLLRGANFRLWLGLLALHIFAVVARSQDLHIQGVAVSALPSSFLLFWIFYFHTGIVCALHRERLHALLARVSVKWLVLISLAAFGLLFAGYWRAALRLPDPSYYDHFHRLTVLVYVLAFWALFWRVDARMAAWITSHGGWARALPRFAAWSYPVFLFHPWILSTLEKTPLQSYWPILTLTLILLSFVLIWVVDAVIRRPVWLRILLALPVGSKSAPRIANKD